MVMMADVPERARFALTLEDYRSLPLGLRDKMLEQMSEWRAQEETARNKLKR